ncbi:MFS transporter superfamily [Fusarium oxysporum f. sp. vasinfectum]|nr:MFS transporter superfamily [Fusarium oxysporum f. sp. vasinfectum]
MASDDKHKNHESLAFDQENGSQIVVDAAAERSYLRKMDAWLLSYLSVMYFFNAVDRSNLGNAETDGMSKDLNFKGEEFSLLILLFYVPNGLCDLPLNLLLKKFSGRIMLPCLMVGWGSMALLQAACKNFAGMLAIRLLLGAFEAGFFAGAVFYLTLFYQRGELGFRIAIFFGSALLASAFSGLISFGVFQIKVSHIHGWMWLFLIEGYNTVITNLLTVPPNVAGFLVLLAVTWSSDRNRERTLHIVGSLSTSLVGLLILAIIDAEAHIGVAYFACFMLCAGAYIPSCLVHSWHNNNNLSENSRAATTGLLVGLGNLGGILSAGTFRTTYAPRYAPTLIGTAACNVTCILFTLGLGFWMRKQNRVKNEAQGVDLKAEDVATSEITHGEQDPRWRYFV